MTSDGKLTFYATPWATQFRDDINSLKEFDEGDDFVRGLNGDLTFFYLYAVDFCALDSNSSKILVHQMTAPMCSRKRRRSSRERDAQHIPVQMLDGRGREVHGFSLKRTQ